jgi:phosphoribosyl-AMP cyclohydrolase
MEIIVFASVSKEQLWEKGKNAGLSDKAAEMFKFAEEFMLELTVDFSTGEVKSGKVIGAYAE